MSLIKCYSCHQVIRPGQEAAKRIEVRRAENGELVAYGEGIAGKPLKAATGAIVEAWHAKHYWMTVKRERRAGQAASGG